MLGYLGDHHGQTIPKDVAVLFEAHTAKTRIDEEQIELAHIEMFVCPEFLVLDEHVDF